MPQPRIIITTEKDAVRLKDADGLSDDVRRHLYALPLHVAFMLEQGQLFDDKILGYVQKNARNSILVRKREEQRTTSRSNIIRF